MLQVRVKIIIVTILAIFLLTGAFWPITKTKTVDLSTRGGKLWVVSQQAFYETLLVRLGWKGSNNWVISKIGIDSPKFGSSEFYLTKVCLPFKGQLRLIREDEDAFVIADASGSETLTMSIKFVKETIIFEVFTMASDNAVFKGTRLHVSGKI